LGAFEVRYVIAQSGRTLASQPVTLVAVSAELEVDGPILPGGQFQVHWTGPDNPQDYITIVDAGAPEGSYEHYQRTSRGSPVTLRAPEAEGDYEVRYVIAQSGRTLASLPVSVGAGEVSLAVEGEVTAGGVITVVWQGPGRFEDFIELVEEGAADSAPALREARASQGSPLQLFAPTAAGSYELRYRASDSGEVLARIPLAVGQ
jgi:Ca-activated chloride channel homolog